MGVYRNIAARQEYLKKYKEANADRMKAWHAANYLANREVILARSKARREASPGAARAGVKAWHEANADKVKSYQESYYRQHAEKLKQRARDYNAKNNEACRQRSASSGAKWRAENPHKNAAKAKKYECQKSQRTPAWLTKDDFWMIEQAYELAALRTKVTGIEWHVDHIIPLKGKLVSGLHVPKNLQVILAKENLHKSNIFAT